MQPLAHKTSINTVKIWTVCLCFLALAFSCNPAKSLTKRGDQFRLSGLHEDAVTFYKQALNNNMLYLEARKGITESANAVLSRRLERVFKAQADNNLKDAVEGFMAAVSLRDEMKRFRVDLEIPSFYFQQFETDKADYLDQLYSRGLGFMENNQFEQAKIQFAEIRKIDPNYRDINNLNNLSIISPKYEQAKRLYDAGDFRKAFNLFKEVFDVDPRFKDTRRLMEDSQNKATLTVAVMGFQSADNTTRSLAQSMQGLIVSALANSRNPFLKVVDRENTDKLLQEQRLALSGITNEQSAVRAGELLGVKAVVIGRVLSYNINQGSLNKATKTGYEAYRERVFDQQTGATNVVTRYRKVNYNQFEGVAYAAARVQYQLVSTETGQVLASQTVDLRKEDVIAFIEYQGDAANLFAGVWRNRLLSDPNDRVYNSSRDKRDIDRLLNGRRNFVPISDLQADLQEDVSDRIARGILSVEYNSRK